MMNTSPIFALFWMLLAVGAAAQSPVDSLLLKDYKPKSIYKIPRTRVEKARYPVIDMHAHPYALDEANLDRWVKTMDAVGVAKVTVMVNRSGKVFDETAALYRKYPGRFDLWCGIDYTGYQEKGWPEKVIAELERCRKAGAVGVGELSDKGRGMMGMKGPVDGWGMHFDDPRMDPILEKCADLGMPVNMHVGEDMWMYEPLDEHNDGLMNAATCHIPDTPEVLRHDAVVETLARAVARHPRTIFIACHYANCCTELRRLGAMLDKYPNLYADIGAR
ncbi:amidohydrolase family protein [bacterium]|nr:amidohydrolase family protein [bacterium]